MGWTFAEFEMLDPDLYNSSTAQVHPGPLREGFPCLGTPHRHPIWMHAVLAHSLRDLAVLHALAQGLKLVCPGSLRPAEGKDMVHTRDF